MRVGQLVFADCGWELELVETVERFVRKSEAHFIATVEEQLGLELGGGPGPPVRALVPDGVRARTRAADGVVEALGELRLPHCVASGGSHAKMQRTLGQAGLWHRFEGRIFSAMEVANGKPAPDLFLHAAGTLGTVPERCAVVEDSPYGADRPT